MINIKPCGEIVWLFISIGKMSTGLIILPINNYRKNLTKIKISKFRTASPLKPSSGALLTVGNGKETNSVVIGTTRTKLNTMELVDLSVHCVLRECRKHLFASGIPRNNGVLL